MPKHGNWGDWAVIGGRHSLEPGVEKSMADHYPFAVKMVFISMISASICVKVFWVIASSFPQMENHLFFSPHLQEIH